MRRAESSRRKPRTAIRGLMVILALPIILVAGCLREHAPEDSIARVGQRYITHMEFESYLDRMIGEDVGHIEPEASSAMLDQLLETALLSQVASARGLTVSEEEVTAAIEADPRASRTEKLDELRRDALIAELSENVTDPSDEEIRSFHRAHLEEFTTGERAHVRQILLRDEAEARRVRREIARGKAFEDAAREYSISPTAEKGGDIGTVTREDLPRTLQEAVFALDPGDVSDVLETSGTYHIFKLMEKHPAGVLSIERTRPLIVSRARGEALSALLAETTANAKQAIPTVVYTARLDFDYTGSFPVDRSE